MKPMVLFASLTALAATTFIGTSTPADAKQVCKPRAELIKLLDAKYGEKQRSFGLQNNRRVLELYASSQGTWTAILTMPSGRSCIVGAGEAWTTLPPIPIGDPA